MRIPSLPAATTAALLAVPAGASAIDLSHHAAGAGVVAAPGAAGPALLSVRSWVQPRLALEGLLGLSASPGFLLTPGVGAAWVLVGEQRMNVSLAGAAALTAGSPGGLRALGWRVGPELELFAAEWPNLGLLLQLGLEGVVGTGEVPVGPGLSTGARPSGAAGFHYYF